MARRRWSVYALAGLFALPSLLFGATHTTQNFAVEAPTPEIARQVGQYAEQYRKEKAQLWLGREMPPWGQRCPIRVTVTMGGAGGATSFAFDNGQILSQHMHIEGSLERLLNSVLPHEVTHTVFAYHFRCPLPRWADEGGAVLSEDEVERDRHDKMVRQILNAGRAIPLRRLLGLKEYPNEVMSLYAEGYSVTAFLVGKSSRPAFLNFIADGMHGSWDAALQRHYQIRNVEELENEWLTHLRNTKRQPAQLASSASSGGERSRASVMRQTVPPVQPFDDLPPAVVRGVSPDPERENPRKARPVSRPGYLPDFTPQIRPASTDGWQAPATPAPVILGPPQFDSQPPAQLGRPVPGGASPVGYPRD
jgi:hypothetical protein